MTDHQTKPDPNGEQALVSLAGRVRARHCEVGGDNDAWRLAVWASDLVGLLGYVRAWTDECRVADDADDENVQQGVAELFAAWEGYLHRRGRRDGG